MSPLWECASLLALCNRIRQPRSQVPSLSSRGASRQLKARARSRTPKTGCVLLIALLFGQALAQKPDGFPAGRGTPEGAACDMARAFIARDPALFSKTVLPPFGGGIGRTHYAAFLSKVKQSMVEEAKKKTPSPKAPRKMLEVFAARRLTKSGPASYGYASFGFKDVQFVDVKVQLRNGLTFMNRTL